MTSRPEPAQICDHAPRILRYCRVCQMQTPHEIRDVEGALVVMCVPCLARVLCYELERD